MKSFIAALFFASCIATTVANVANAGNCQTTCQWVGDMQFCNTHCN